MGITYIIFGLLQVSATLASLVSLNLTLNLWPVDKADKLDKPNKEGDLDYDFIIVGAGTAGCILAEQLSEDKRFKVAVFEAGGKPSEESMDPGYVSKLPNSPINWNFTSKYKPCEATQFKGNVYHFTSGKVIGGSSIMGYMVYARGAPHDLEVIAEAAKDNTYDYASITSYFKKSERLEDKQVLKTCYGDNYGKNGSMGMARQPHAINKKYLEAFSELNKTIVLDTNGPNTIGYAEPMFMISGGKRQSTALTSLARAAGRDNLDVFLNTEVTKILINTNNRAVGIHVKTNSGKIVTVKVKREVIVCAGVYKSPQLLMLSGIGIRKDLQLLDIPVKVDLPVGKYYKDHTGVYLNIKLNITTDKTPSSDPSEFPSPTIIGYDTLNKSQSYPDFRNRIFIIPSGSKTLLTQCSDEYSFKNEICDHFYSQTKGHEVMSIKIGQLHSMSQGEITLRSSNPDDQPDITPGYFSNEKDLENLVDYVLDILKIQNTKTFKKYNASIVYPDLPECDVKPRVSRDYWSCICKSMATSMYDTSGTCSIGPVVDNRLRVHQTEGIRVADASVLSYSPSGGVQAQTMTIAYKAADMIKEDNKNKVDAKDKNKEENTDKNKEDTKDKNKEENTDKNKEDNKNKQKENNILGLTLSLL